MCWADKISAAVFALIFIALLVLGMLPGAADYPFELGRWISAFIIILGHVLLKVILPLWLALRAIDFIAGGPRRRLGARRPG